MSLFSYVVEYFVGFFTFIYFIYICFDFRSVNELNFSEQQARIQVKRKTMYDI